MMDRQPGILVAFALAALCLVASLASSTYAEPAAEKIRVLIIDGQNNHNWKDTTPFLSKELESTGRFTVSVSTTPPRNATDEQWKSWKPEFSACDVVLSNYNGPAWPEHVRSSFEEFMRDGGGLVNVHAANNAHGGWTEFEKMTGLLWRGKGHGPRLYLDDDGKTVRLPKGEGHGAGHGRQHDYKVQTRDVKHPITSGLPETWLHARDELYHGQRGPAEGMEILVTAFSDKETGGTGVHEPMLWWIPYGKGRAVTNLLGHVDRGDATKMPAMRCTGFLALLARSCEWVATGKVTLEVPKDLPTTEKTRLRGDD